MKGNNFQKLNEIKVFKMATIFQINQILNESKNKTINVAWLYVGLLASNIDGALSKHVDPVKYNDSDYPDLVQEIQSWIAKIITAKRVIVSKQVKIKKSLLKLVKEVEHHPEQLIQIFYKNRYFFEKYKNKSQINNHEQTF